MTESLRVINPARIHPTARIESARKANNGIRDGIDELASIVVIWFIVVMWDVWVAEDAVGAGVPACRGQTAQSGAQHTRLGNSALSNCW